MNPLCLFPLGTSPGRGEWKREKQHMSRAQPSGEKPSPVPVGANLVVLAGYLSRTPTVTRLRSGDELLRCEVTIRRSGTGENPGRAETVPVVWFAPRRPPLLSEGSRVVVLGRVRRRFFGVGGRTASRTEVVAERVWRDTPQRRQRVRGLVLSSLGSMLGA